MEVENHDEQTGKHEEGNYRSHSSFRSPQLRGRDSGFLWDNRDYLQGTGRVRQTAWTPEDTFGTLGFEPKQD